AVAPRDENTLHDLAAHGLLRDDVADTLRMVLRRRALAPFEPPIQRLYALALLRLADERKAGDWHGPRPWRSRLGPSADERHIAEALLAELSRTAVGDASLLLSLGSARLALNRIPPAMQ